MLWILLLISHLLGSPPLLTWHLCPTCVHSCSSCSTIPPLANSDHLGLSLSVKKDCTSTTPPPCRRVWRYKHADFERANELLCDLDLDSILDPTNIQTSWRRFKSAFLEIMEHCVPRFLVPDRKNLPWLSKVIIQLINYYFNLAHHTGSPADRQKFKHLRNKVVSRLGIAKQNYFSKLHPKNQKELWKILQSINKKDFSIPPLTNGSFIAASSSDKANLLNVTFSSYFNRAVSELSPSDLPESVPDVCPEDILCSEDEVYELLCSLDTTKGSGDDDISAIMLKATALSITSAVTQLFNISLKLGEIPEDWKVARVTPIPKSHGKSDPDNYHPISLLSVLSKLLEKYVHNLLITHLDETNPISAQQWGFTLGKSTTGALLAGMNFLTLALTSVQYFFSGRLLILSPTGLFFKSSLISVFIPLFSDG